MYTSILVLLDGSAFAERALPIALALAQRSGARVELVHVHEPYVYASGAPMTDAQFHNEAEEHAHQGLEALAQRLARQSGIDIAFTCLDGPVVRTLGEYLGSSRADLVVMTTHGYGGLSRLWLGSVAEHLIRHSPIPVLLVRPGATGAAHGEPLFRRILVPLDGSTLAVTALEHAVNLATPGESELTLLQVVVPIPVHGNPYPATAPLFDRADLERRCSEARAYLDRVGAELRKVGFNVRTEALAHRHVARGILDYARGHDTELIALATHGRGGVGKLLLGSVADKILRGAKTPLLVHHPLPRQDYSGPAKAAEAGAGLTASG